MRQRFFMSCNSWWENHEMHDINIKKWSLSKLFCETTLQTIFSILSKTQWITSYITLKHTSKLYKSQIKVCTSSLHINTIEMQLSFYNEEQLIMHFFTKLQSEIRKILLNYKNLLNQQDSLVTLIACLKNNLCESDTTVVKKVKKDICTRSTSN